MGETLWRPFTEARAYVQNLGLSSRREWRSWAKSAERPADIPANPERTYKNEWKGMGNWLGTDTVSVRNREMWPFEMAREFVHSLRIQNYDAWCAWRSSGNRPPYIPSDPAKEYPGQFKGYPDWLGTNGGVDKLPFAEARAIARSLGVYGQKEWQQLCRDEKCPPGVPKDPRKAYEGEFQGYRDWTGTEELPVRRPRLFLSYQEARDMVRARRFTSWEEWEAWREEDDFPKDLLPRDPKGYYSGEWGGVADWIGTVNRWTRKTLLRLLESLQDLIPHLEDHELYMVLQKCEAMPALRVALGGVSAKQVLAALKMDSGGIKEAITQAADAADAPEAATTGSDDLADGGEVAWQERAESEATEGVEQRGEAPVSAKEFAALDALLEATYGMAEGFVEDLIRCRIHRLWGVCINQGRSALDAFLGAEGGRLFTETKQRFLGELAAAEALTIPDGYDFHTADGCPAQPNLMQRHVAAQMLERPYFGVWSGAGAGKSLGGILASRVTGARLTVVVTNNATVGQWQRQILNAFPDSVVFTDADEARGLKREDHTWIVLNYEKFQLRNRNKLVQDVLALAPDFLIFDEVQFVKQREAQAEPTKRRQALLRLRSCAAKQNPRLKVLVMSGTPVLNDLAEAEALLRIETDGEQGALDVRASVNNGLRMFYALQRHGFRHRPQYEQETVTRYVPTVRGDLLQAFVASSGQPLTIEQTLLAAKLEAAAPFFADGTLVYTHYTDAVVTPIRRFLEARGFKVGLYTGTDKSGLVPFLKGEVNILIGSDPIATGVDELQYRSNRLVFINLPWTGAMYEQTIGRLLRQGSHHKKVDVIIPQVVFERGDASYSWDRLRLAKIEYKQTLSDCAVDGTIPEAVRISKADLQRQSRAALEKFLARVHLEDMLGDLPNYIVDSEDMEFD